LCKPDLFTIEAETFSREQSKFASERDASDSVSVFAENHHSAGVAAVNRHFVNEDFVNGVLVLQVRGVLNDRRLNGLFAARAWPRIWTIATSHVFLLKLGG
jgi:hypothetical protein